MAEIKQITIPDIGGATDVEVIEVLVSVGDQVNKDDSLITLESDKASMEIPAPYAGTIKELKVQVGSKVSEGDLIAMLEASGAVTTETKPAAAKQPTAAAPATPATSAAPQARAEMMDDGSVHASPSVRRVAHELGINLSLIKGTGRKARITKQDIIDFIRGSGGSGLPEAPDMDFTEFGEVEVQPLSRINKLSAANLHRNWLLIPHVTQFDEADITEMETFRQQHKNKAKEQGFNLTPLVFLMKAVVAGLQEFPRFNASLDKDVKNLIVKKYFHIGVAVDTPDGLVVPVIRNVEQKSLMDLAQELGEVSAKARDGKLKRQDMMGNCFTISSLGGIGGTAFTPIVNMPDVAILGVSRSSMQPVYQDGKFVPRLMLPLSLSYDHRVIDGAQAVRFTTFLAQRLADVSWLKI